MCLNLASTVFCTRYSRAIYEPQGNQSLVVAQSTPKEKGLENALYISDKFNVTSRLSVEAGIRYSLFQYIGPRDVFQYIDGLPRSTATITDTV